MLGAIIGDIVGSRFEHENLKSKTFEFFSQECHFTDDTVMTIAIGNVLRNNLDYHQDIRNETIKEMQRLGHIYPNIGFGTLFYNWLVQENPKPYGSYGNGAAMRVSACGIVAKNLSEVKTLSRQVTDISHDHPEGLLAAFVTAGCVCLARQGQPKTIIFDFASSHYNIDFRLDAIREDYAFDATCQETMPVALAAFFESDSFEDAIRNAISVGGDSDTIAAITGSIAAEYFGIPRGIYKQGKTFLDAALLADLDAFEVIWPAIIV